MRHVSGIKPFCNCDGGTVRMMVVCDDPDVWFEIIGQHEAKCAVQRMVKHWESQGYHLMPSAPGRNSWWMLSAGAFGGL